MGAESKRILVADDEPQIRLLLSEYLGGKGFEVRTVADGQEALEALEAERFDAAVVDLAMPRMDGVSLINAAAQRRLGVAFVVITGYPSDRAILEAMQAGTVRFLTKPFKLEDVLEAVHTAIRAGRDGPGAASAGMAIEARPHWVEVTAPSGDEYRDRLEHLFELLSGGHLPPREVQDVRIALGEIVANAIEWGNRHDRNKPVRVSYCLFPEELVFKIEDLGVGFDPEGVPDPLSDPLERARERAEQGKRPGGFGLTIARRVMDRVIYNRLGNTVVMSKRLGTGG